MNALMYWLAPKGLFGFVARLIFLTSCVAMANMLFATLFDDNPSHDAIYYVGHALFVGTPLIAFFLAVTVFQIRLQRKLWRLSRKDGLTGLNNRRTFFNNTIAARKGSKEGVLLMLDADLFKSINDQYGHHAGDMCLKSIAHTLQRNVRESDVVGRIGGEEFAIYLKDTTAEQAKVIGERLTKPIAFRTKTDEHLTVTLSIGATIAAPALTLDGLFAAADDALYAAKQNGRAQIIFSNYPIGPQPALGGLHPSFSG